jgi:protein-L-isoaspartate O-methyltransferase
MVTRRTLLIGPLALFLAGTLCGQDSDAKLAPYYPTPNTIVDRMLKLGRLTAGETMFDLGSGDGRVIIMAARKFGANAIGVEIDEDLCKQSTKRIQDLGLQKKARIIQGDLLAQDYSSANLVTVYLLPASIEKVRPILEKQLKKGARVVSHDFVVSGWTPVKEEVVEDDGEGRSHSIYLYQR